MANNTTTKPRTGVSTLVIAVVIFVVIMAALYIANPSIIYQ